MPLCDAHHTALIRAKASSFTPCSPPLPPSSAPLPPPFPQLVSHRFAQLLGHRRSLLSQRWLFGIADEFITKQLPHNVTWGLSLLFALEAPRGASEEGRMGAGAHTDRHAETSCSVPPLLLGGHSLAELEVGIAAAVDCARVALPGKTW